MPLITLEVSQEPVIWDDAPVRRPPDRLMLLSKPKRKECDNFNH